MRHNRIIAIGLLAFTAVAGYLTTQLSESTMLGEPGPKFFPTLILILIAILSLVLFTVGGNRPRAAAAADSLRIEERLSTREAALFFGVFLAGLGCMKLVGFSLSMIAALTAMLTLAGWKIFPRALVFSGVLVLAVYFLFDRLLEITLPTGILLRL
ncbi:MAG: tripartite tricarboxylate transporter TctB family protein [Planctomycetota bacterium]|jgi:hypothetical protein|nr:tripartite tricarboxylate transporter TctB family protein [Planctomycetota bacterium]